MARKKSRFSMLVWALITAVFGGGTGGYFKPDLPIIGPLVSRFVGTTFSAEEIDAKKSQLLTQAASAVENSSLGQSHVGQAAAQYMTAQYGANQYASPQQTSAQYASAQYANAQRPSNSILIASFNIQVLGKSKMSKPDVVQILAQVIRLFDIVAIQEVRAKEDDIVPSLVAAVNSNGSRYGYLVGPRLGRTVSTEQYAFVFDTTRVEHEPSSVGTISDPSDLLHREPFVARFRARTQSPNQAFTFWMVDTHTDPDEVPQEVNALADVFQVMQTARPDEDDVILLGDLNASPAQLGRLGQLPGIMCAIHDVMTNTRQDKIYDNIIFAQPSTSEFTGRWGVLNLEQVFGISRDEALKVSDHLPVWAEFQIWESPSQTRFADRMPGLRR